jgi:hypothetical protein
MGQKYKKPARFVASGKVKAFLSESGEVLYVDINGELYEGVGDFVPVPIADLRKVRLNQIPEEVFIEPVAYIDKNIVYMLRFGNILTYEVKFGRSSALVNVEEWAADWKSYIGLEAMKDALSSTLRELLSKGFISFVDMEDEDDMMYVSFEIPLPETMTIRNAVKTVRKILREIEKEATIRASLLAIKEARRNIEKRSRKRDEGSLVERVSRIFYKEVEEKREDFSKK